MHKTFIMKVRKMEMVINKVTFAETEEIDLIYYANLNWKESAKNAELMRKMVWNKEYELPISKELRLRNLKDDDYDFE